MHLLVMANVLHPVCQKKQVKKLPASLTGSLSFILFQRKLIIDFVKAHPGYCFVSNGTFLFQVNLKIVGFLIF